MRRYPDRGSNVVVLTQHFPSGLVPENQHGMTNEVVSGFPTLRRAHIDLGVLDFEGVQLQNTR